MTLDEAIKHCEEVAWELDKKAMCIEEAYQSTEQAECEKCAEDHRQLAEWLTELKERRENLTKISEQISSIKRNVKSENSDYLTGYISALSTVEGVIAEIDGGAENG